MALVDKKLTELTEILSVPDNAFIHVVDPNDVSQSPQGSSYKAKKSTIGGAVKAQVTVSGTVKVDSNNSDPVVYLKGSVDALLSEKQNTLVNGINIASINGQNLLNGGNIEIANTPITIDAEVLQNSTNAVSGGGVYDFVQPILEKTVPIITDSFTILDSVDSKRKKLTFDNLINYVKVFIDDSLSYFKTINFLDATSSIQTQINSALNRTFAQLVGSAGIITNSARIYWINGLFNSSINQESLDFTFYNQPNNQYRFLRMNSGGITTRKVYNGDSYGFEFPEGIGVGAFQPEITAGLPITIQKFKTYINTVNTVYNPAYILTNNFEFTIRVIAGTATFSSTSFVFYPGDNVILRYFSGVWTVFNLNNPTLNVLPKKGASGFVDSAISEDATNVLSAKVLRLAAGLTPVNAQDLTPKSYVDASLSGKIGGTQIIGRIPVATASNELASTPITYNSETGLLTVLSLNASQINTNGLGIGSALGFLQNGTLGIVSGQNGLAFSTNYQNIANGTEHARFNTLGNFGINKTAPTEKLDVIGNIQLSNLLKLGQFTTATEPAYVKGASFFNTTLNKIRIGGATAYETVTSS